ncbi:TRAP transporter permease [Chloroflexota bacterium]
MCAARRVAAGRSQLLQVFTGQSLEKGIVDLMQQEQEVQETTGQGRLRLFRGPIAWFITGICAIMSTFAILLHSTVFARIGLSLDTIIYRAAFLLVLLITAFLLYPGKNRDRSKVPWYDMVLIALCLPPLIYLIAFQNLWLPNLVTGRITDYEVVLGIMLLVVVFEAMRRVAGIGIVVIVLAFIIHPFVANYLPGVLHAPNYSLSRALSVWYTGTDGIFGLPLGIIFTIVLVFMVLARLLDATGSDKAFTNVGLALFGGVAGGPAKAAVIASGLFGSISGGSAANVAVTGIVTIPMMKKTGYTPEYAAAVEAVASNGGHIMPPVMAATVFIMAQIMGMPYIQIIYHAILPALLYYFAIFAMVHLEAKKRGIKGLPREQVPPLGASLKTAWPPLVALIVLVVAMAVLKLSPQLAALVAASFLFVLTLFSDRTRLNWRKAIYVLEGAVKSCIVIGIACAGAGIIMGSLSLTGVGIKLSSLLIDVSGGSILTLLGLTAVAAFVIGVGSMGLIAYLMLALLIAPTLGILGVFPVAAHLFIYYWAITSFITPPVCMAVFVAAPIAGARISKTGLVAMRLGIGTYLLPFLFVLNTSLLLIGNPLQIGMEAIIAIIGLSAIAIAMTGFAIGPVNWVMRSLLAIGALAFMLPELTPTIIGFGLIFVAILWHIIKMKRPNPLEALHGR